MKFNADYFIEKFTAIPEEKWCVGKFYDFGGRCCALGHCERIGSKEGVALIDLLNAQTSLINDGKHPDFPQPTPKLRILAALNEIKRKEQVV